MLSSDLAVAVELRGAADRQADAVRHQRHACMQRTQYRQPAQARVKHANVRMGALECLRIQRANLTSRGGRENCVAGRCGGICHGGNDAARIG